MLYVIHDKKEKVPGKLAGVIGYMNTSALNLVTEIGFVMMCDALSLSLDEKSSRLTGVLLVSFSLPHAQRTHVLTHSASLLFDNAFNLPSESGLGLRRVQWQGLSRLFSSSNKHIPQLVS